MLLHHWWNGAWGRWHRRDVWIEELDDGRFLVRWRGGPWTDRDGRFVTASPKIAVAAARALVEYAPGEWREVDSGGTPGR